MNYVQEQLKTVYKDIQFGTKFGITRVFSINFGTQSVITDAVRDTVTNSEHIERQRTTTTGRLLEHSLH